MLCTSLRVRFSDKAHASLRNRLRFLAGVACDSGNVLRPGVGISDGDTLTILVDKRQVKVRINGIDAPEKGQPFAERSKQNLSSMAFQNGASLACHKKN